jgi:fatty-acid peroxygenase
MSTPNGAEHSQPFNSIMPPDIPRAGSGDATLAMLREGYDFISSRCDRLSSDIFRTRVMLKDVICMRGPDAARLLYGDQKLTRQGSLPQTVLRLLQDKGSVQQLNDGQHLHRKSLFIRMLMQPGSVAALIDIFRKQWTSDFAHLAQGQEVVLIDAVNHILTCSACKWAGVPLPPTDAKAMTKALAGMVENAGHVRPATFGTLFRRNRVEAHLRTVIGEIRSGHLAQDGRSPAVMIAEHVDFDGNPMPLKIAAVELLNVLRPVVAVGRFIVFAALALHQHPEWRERFAAGEDDLLEPFAEEVRRTSPFFPFVGAVATRDIHWRDYHFPKGQWLLLDLYGTIRDARSFAEPDVFRPERNLSWKDQDWTFIPQGAGPATTTHRCPGEQITVEIIKDSVRLLSAMRYGVPSQDFTVKKNRIPALPESGFVMTGIHPMT